MANIEELTRQLREEFRKQYGLDAHIKINVFDNCNNHINLASAGQLALAMAHVFGKPASVQHWEYKNTHGVSVRTDGRTLNNVDITIFYPGGRE